MVEDERVPGSTASLEGRADDSVAASPVERVLEGLFGGDPAGQVDVVHADDAHVLLRGSFRAGTSVEPVPVDVDLLVAFNDSYFDAEFRSRIQRALAAVHERQPVLPGLGDLGGQRVGTSDRSLLLSAAMFQGLGAERLRLLRDRIAEIMSATEVPIRALRNPGKVLGELAEKGEIARVTNHGKTVGWLMPATEAEQHLDALLTQGRLRRGTPAPIEPIDIEGLERPLSEALTDARDRERA